MKIVRAMLLLLASGVLVAAGPFASDVKADPICTIPVKILADQREPTSRQIWEKRYRDRFTAASEIFERSCGVRFKVVAVDTWKSDDKANGLEQLIDEFEKKVKSAPARLSVGFTGQYYGLVKDRHIGGTRGPLRSHILIREWGQQVTEPERIEILVHELGHYLGAVHSPEHQSVMRPDISDRQSRSRGFQVSFDARNAEAIRLVAKEYAKRPLVSLGQLPSASKERLKAVYGSLAAGLPSDPAAKQFLALLGQSAGVVGEPPKDIKELIAGSRSVVRAVTAAAEKNRRLPKRTSGVAATAFQVDGDELAEYYVRQAATAARQLPPSIAAKAMLVGLGVALDGSPLPPKTPGASTLLEQIEPRSARATRLASLGAPTMRGRRDLAQHFAVSAALAVLVGPQVTEQAGVAKEISDSRGGSGFSFADLLADIAGIEFASAVVAGRLPLAHVESRFFAQDFLPDVIGFKEAIPWKDFSKQYGSPPDERLSRVRELLRRRVLAMPGYMDAVKPPVSKKQPLPY